MRKQLVPSISLIALVSLWSAYALLANPISTLVAHKWGPALVKAGDGKFADAELFLRHRFYEAAWLASLAIILMVIAIYVGTLFARRTSALWKWVPFSVSGFVCLNLWIKLATATCLFWCFFWNGKGTTDNLTQFHIKLLMMDENRAQTKVVLAGSSQVHAQVDPAVMNREFGSNMFTTELHFPGNHSFDFLFLERKLAGHQANVIVCYLSEGNFYLGGWSDGAPLFFSVRDLPEFVRLGGRLEWSAKSCWYSLLANVAPVFWIRDPLTERILGGKITRLQQNARDAALPLDLRQRALLAAENYRADAQSDFCFRAFEAFVAHCRSQQQIVVVCCGQVNPILARELDPALRSEMVRYLNRLSKSYDNVVLLDEQTLPHQTEADYDDLSHVNTAARLRFTRQLGACLKNIR